MDSYNHKNNENLVKKFFDNYVYKFDYIYETQYSEQNPLKRFLDKLLRKSMIDRFNLTKEYIENSNIKTILDAGCGTGRYSFYFGSKNYDVTGIDISEKMIDFCNTSKQKTENTNFVKTSLENFSTTKNIYAIICLGFFDYIDNVEHSLEQINKFNPKLVVASFPNKFNFLNYIRIFRYKMNKCPLFYYTKEQINNFSKIFPNYDLEIKDLKRDILFILKRKNS